jgi:hypothetical protein
MIPIASGPSNISRALINSKYIEWAGLVINSPPSEAYPAEIVFKNRNDVVYGGWALQQFWLMCLASLVGEVSASGDPRQYISLLSRLTVSAAAAMLWPGFLRATYDAACFFLITR